MAYPSMLPNFTVDYQYSDKNNFIRTEMDGGPPRIRKKSTAGSRVFSVKSIFSSIELEIFEAWLRDSINDGEDTFSVDLDLSNTATTHTVLMNGKPNVRYSGVDAWLVSFDLTTENIQYLLTESLLDDYLTWYELGLTTSMVSALHTLVHVTLPAEIGDSI